MRGGDPRLFHLSFLSTIDLKAPRIDFLMAGALDYAPLLPSGGGRLPQIGLDGHRTYAGA